MNRELEQKALAFIEEEIDRPPKMARRIIETTKTNQGVSPELIVKTILEEGDNECPTLLHSDAPDVERDI